MNTNTTANTNTPTHIVTYRCCGEWHSIPCYSYWEAADKVNHLIETGGADFIDVPGVGTFTLTAEVQA